MNEYSNFILTVRSECLFENEKKYQKILLEGYQLIRVS